LPNGLELLNVGQMAEADRLAIASGVPGETLMEAAGRAVADAVCARWQAGRVLVLCGPGNNGGDGFVAARHLRQRGWEVRLHLLGARGALKGDAALHAARWEGEALPLAEADPGWADLVVDALFGAGLARALAGDAKDVIERVKASGLPLVAVDVPSGLKGDDGTPFGETVAEAALTVTFFRKKPGHLLLPGRTLCGEVMLADIGIPDQVLQEIEPLCWENGPALWRASFPRRGAASHKYDAGHLLVRGGLSTGAARLASRAALRVGAGLVTLAGPKALHPLYALSAAAVMLDAVDGPQQWRAALKDERRRACLIGPGNGVDGATRQAVLDALAAARDCVLDADALSAFEGEGEALFAARRGALVLTPHEGEFKRLFPDLAQGSKLQRARDAARRSGGVLLLKGADTVIAAPDGRAAINANAPPHLATAGSGDVLAGLLAGLVVQGMPAFEAAAAAAWLQGKAASSLGPGMIADDLVEAIPGALTSL
jgi:NAD(P)H-hydrate epimerase